MKRERGHILVYICVIVVRLNMKYKNNSEGIYTKFYILSMFLFFTKNSKTFSPPCIKFLCNQNFLLSLSHIKCTPFRFLRLNPFTACIDALILPHCPLTLKLALVSRPKLSPLTLLRKLSSL